MGKEEERIASRHLLSSFFSFLFFLPRGEETGGCIPPRPFRGARLRLGRSEGHTVWTLESGAPVFVDDASTAAVRNKSTQPSSLTKHVSAYVRARLHHGQRGCGLAGSLTFSGLTVYKCLVLVYQTLQTCLTYTQIRIQRVLGQGDRCGWLAMASKETSSEIGVLSSGGFDLWYKGILKSVGLILPPQFGCAFSWIRFLSKNRILGDLQFFGG